MTQAQLRFAIVGPGRVGRTLARAFVQRGHVPAGVIARRSEAAEAALVELVAGAARGGCAGREAAGAEGSSRAAAEGAGEARGVASSLRSAGRGQAGTTPADLHAVVRADDAPQGVRRAEVSEVIAAADLLLITTPDRAIAPVAEALAATSPPTERTRPGIGVLRSAFHTSGALPADVLQPLRDRGYRIGTLHPIQTFASVDPTGEGLRGISWGIEGEPDAVRMAERLVAELGGHPLIIRPGAKALYHAGACVAANYLVVLVDLALRCYAAAGIEGDEALSALLPLMEGALQNVREYGIPAALTGPIERGDAATVAGHLQAFAVARLDGEAADLYRMLGRGAVALAEKRGSIAEECVAALRSLLQGDRVTDGRSVP